jgi:putative glycosyltransferase (TIGR04348 family)
MRIALVTPAGARARNGNRHTALRWAAFLRAAGHRVAVSTEWSGGEADLLLALHARRSYDSIRRFAASYPQRRLLVALTGTDVYRDIHESAEAQQSLELAHRLIVLQPKAAEELPERLRSKVSVVVQSCATRLRHAPVKGKFRVCVIGHLREEKDPLRIVVALPYLDAIQVIHLGAALDESLGRQALAAMQRDSRYRWLGGVPHGRALAWLASSHAMVISSRMEGGANVVCEALRVGVPVLASRISGNVGLLGERYPAYFALEDEKALAELIHRAATDKKFYKRVKNAVERLRPMVAPRAEARALLDALKADPSGTKS